jgi:hypothetical protein
MDNGSPSDGDFPPQPAKIPGTAAAAVISAAQRAILRFSENLFINITTLFKMCTVNGRKDKDQFSSLFPEKNIFTVITIPKTELIMAIDKATMLRDIPAEEL